MVDGVDREPPPVGLPGTLAPPQRTATLDASGGRQWVYADLPRGRFARARNAANAVLILFYLAAPWLTVGGQPFLRFDLPARRFSIFGAVFVATDLYLLALLLLIAAIAMFFFSALLGRLWCGWACPQTVFLEGVFRRIERWIEGTPLQRRRLDDGPRDDVYRLKKLVKHAVFLALSVLLAFSFTAYFIEPRAAFGMLRNAGAGYPAAFITALVLTGTTYWNFAWFREQFCTFLCPYARFQAVMLDDHSLIVGYDPHRGEPRGPLRPGQAWGVRGDCVDCRRCVQVCPTGIDIRDGLQLECVSCTACIDACDAVMDRIGRPRGLVRYDSLAGLARRPRRIVRSRVLLYAMVMLALTTVFAAQMANRSAVDLTVARAPGIPYIVQDDGRIRNMFRLHLTNTQLEACTLALELADVPDAELIAPGQPYEVPAGQRVTTEVFVLLPKQALRKAEIPVRFMLNDAGMHVAEADAIFLGPVFRGETK